MKIRFLCFSFYELKNCYHYYRMITLNRTYIAIDLKSFYASVECVERGLDPLNTNLVVADKDRTNKTICLAVSPSLKSYGIPGRPRLFEVVQKVNRLNRIRQKKNHWKKFRGTSYTYDELEKNQDLEIDYIIATPRMSFYMEYSTQIYNVYLKYVSSEDIHVYSIDEVFIDITSYLKIYEKSAHELALEMIKDVLRTTGITATAGIGTNLYLAKVAMDIVAKHIPADEDGVRIAELDEMKYRELLWDHKPITDFWRVGHGYAKRLENYNLFTMGDIARFSLEKDGYLYDEFGINAELLIDHAWGYESCTMKDIKSYKPTNNSLGSGQVLMEPYSYDKAKVIVREMVDNLVLDLVQKNLVTDHVRLFINYDASSNLENFQGEVGLDWYGRPAPKPAGGSTQLKELTSSTKIIMDAILDIYTKTVNPKLLVRRVTVTANHVVSKSLLHAQTKVEQFDLFTDTTQKEIQDQHQKEELEKEEKIQKAMLDIKNRFGKNAVLKGTNFEEGATGRDRNKQIGGHKG